MRYKIVAVFLAAFLAFPICVHAADELYLGGDSVGIEVRYDGVMVTGTYAIQIDGALYDPKDHGISNGDMIVSVNDVSVSTLEELHQQLMKYKNDTNQIPVTIKHGDQTRSETLLTKYSNVDHTFQSGLYVKDKITGVGTLTFYDPVHETFGALGHEIYDSDQQQIADIHDGTLYASDVTSFTPAQKNIAGEKHAKILYDEIIGSIDKNTKIGIYGTYDTIKQDIRKLPWAKQEEIHTGTAEIYTVLDNKTIESYSINITKLHPQSEMDMKGIEFEVDDERLLSKTNGIIQGMSGSPIVQDGKIVGAITHVITSKPINGYGVYIEWMLKEANE